VDISFDLQLSRHKIPAAIGLPHGPGL